MRVRASAILVLLAFAAEAVGLPVPPKPLQTPAGLMVYWAQECHARADESCLGGESFGWHLFSLVVTPANEFAVTADARRVRQNTDLTDSFGTTMVRVLEVRRYPIARPAGEQADRRVTLTPLRNPFVIGGAHGYRWHEFSRDLENRTKKSSADVFSDGSGSYLIVVVVTRITRESSGGSK